MSEFSRARVNAGALTLPGHYYNDPGVFQQEIERIFLGSWMCIGRSEQIAHAGDYFLFELGPESLIIVRDQHGDVHAHFNVCSHRGTRICEQHSGRFSETIQCPYHAWTFALDGTLRSARHMQETPGFDTADWPLVSVRIVEWEGFLLLCADESAPPFEHNFAPLLGRFSRWGLPELRLGKRISYEVQANWKLIVQNYSECYHCPLIHPQLVEISPWRSGRNDLSEGPFLGGFMDLLHKSMTSDNGHSPRPTLAGLDHNDLQRVYYYSIFPNLLLSLHPDYVMAHTLTPLSHDRTQVVCEWFFDPQTMAQPDFDPSDAVAFWDTTNRQDWHVCELSQRGIASRAYRSGPYAQAEGLLHAFDSYYLQMMA
jgi:Rieske 2Fe-2S family protein